MSKAPLLAQFSQYMRRKRFKIFEKLIYTLPKPIRIIDVGGTVNFWETCGLAGNPELRITLVNLKLEKNKYINIDSRAGNGTDLGEYSMEDFDVAVSNSVIEHVGSFELQKKFANEIQRVSRAYWVQTPNFYFPIEQHYLLPFLHWMPGFMRIALFRRSRLLCRDAEDAVKVANSLHLLTYKKLRELFPKATIVPERFFGMIKSWIVFGGFTNAKNT